jgi:hypothetical protein
MALAIVMLACQAAASGAQPFTTSPAPAAPPAGEPQSLAPPPANLAAPGPSDILRPPAPIPLPVAPLPSPPQVERPPAAPSPPVQATPVVPPGQVALYLSARFGRDMPPVPGGIVWRVFPDRPDAAGVMRPLREDKNAAPTLMLPPGGYIVHATMGHAQALKKVQLRAETVREVFDLPAGGIRIEGKVGDARIPSGQIHFDVYKGSQFEPGAADRRPLIQNAVTGEVMLVPEGTYHIVSHYGDGNAVVRSDIRVQAARVTDVTVNHRAAVITLKLVASDGGEALANTQWSVLTPGGDVIKESIGAFPRVVLAEGEYRVIARNDGRSFQHDFKVVPGVDREIAVVAR